MTPTQAQIEAAEREIDNVFGPMLRDSENDVTKGMSKQTIRDVATRALTAAAEVGEQYPQVEFTRTETELRSAVLEERERCAQMADRDSNTIAGRRIGDAIRALKDKPDK